MLKRYAQLPILIVLAVTAILLFIIISANKPEKASNSFGSVSPADTSNPLTVSQDGSQSTTNISGADLQQASPPSKSASSAEVNPQQAVPSYCTEGQVPTDGCVPRT